MSKLIVRIEVTKLFGDRDIVIQLPADERVAFLHGPNGAGKSTVLRMMEALFRLRIEVLESISFTQFVVVTDDGTRFGARRRPVKRPTGSGANRNRRIHGQEFAIEFFSDGTVWTPPAADLKDASVRRLLEEWIPDLERIDVDAWFDSNQHDVVTFGEALRRYNELLPPGIHRIGDGPPPEIGRVAGEFAVELIGAQRLQGQGVSRKRGSVGRPVLQAEAVVDRQREAMSLEISRALAAYAEHSQSLDRTFPIRLLDTLAERKSPPSAASVRQQVHRVAELRADFEGVGLLDEGEAELTPDRAGAAKTAERRMLALYLDDVRKKLGQLEPLAQRLELFKRLINQKFDRKLVSIDRAQGYVVYDQSGNAIRPSQLSSGEQHELVLLYRLIFSPDPRVLFLVDEPELSLHVAWQESVTRDLEEIAALVDAQFVLATHSPVVTGERWDLLVDMKTAYRS